MPQQRTRGYTDIFERYADLLADTLYRQRERLAEIAGPPWGSSQVSEREALQRLLAWDEPLPQYRKRAEELSKADLARAALDAIKLVTRAAERGDPEAVAYMERKRMQGFIPPATPIPPTPGLPPVVLPPPTAVLPPTLLAPEGA